MARFTDEILESVNTRGAPLPRSAMAASISGFSLLVIDPDAAEPAGRIVVLALELDRMRFNDFPPYA
jgi:hypothetical protein